MIWASLIVLFTGMMIHILQRDLKENLGTSMATLAVDFAQNLHLSNQDVASLKKVSYDDLIENPINVAFEKKARKVMALSNIRYIYVEVVLPAGKYQVEKGEESLYDATLGTNLNLIYLLDAVPKDEDRFLDGGTRPFDDKQRYNITSVDTKEKHAKKNVSYAVNEDLWGKYLSGFAPLYSTEGDYIGLVGVDLNIATYDALVFRYVLFVVGFVIINSSLLIYAILGFFKNKRQANFNSMDILTQTFNRAKVWEELVSRWYVSKQENHPIAIYLLDIDYFKEYNDFYGHIAGDDVLKRVSQAIQVTLTPYHSIVGRYGGDRFLCVVEEILPEEAVALGLKINQCVSALKIDHIESSISDVITVSVGGVVTVPHLHITPEEAFDLTNNILYEVKQVARNTSKVKTLH